MIYWLCEPLFCCKKQCTYIILIIALQKKQISSLCCATSPVFFWRWWAGQSVSINCYGKRLISVPKRANFKHLNLLADTINHIIGCFVTDHCCIGCDAFFCDSCRRYGRHRISNRTVRRGHRRGDLQVLSKNDILPSLSQQLCLWRLGTSEHSIETSLKCVWMMNQIINKLLTIQ